MDKILHFEIKELGNLTATYNCFSLLKKWQLRISVYWHQFCTHWKHCITAINIPTM